MSPHGSRSVPVPAVFVTGNPGKLAEARRLLPGLSSEALDLPEIQSLDVDEILRHKAGAAWESVGRPVIVDETSLELSALGGFPGPLVKWMLKSVGAEGMARIARHEGDARAVAVCALHYYDGAREISVRGSVDGELVLPPRGDHGFGWDPVFQPAGSARTYAEMEPTRKDRVSHRARAWRALSEALVSAGIRI